MRARLVGCHWPRSVHQYVAHMRHVGPIRARRRVAARRFRERLQSLDQLRLRARYRQVSTFQLHFEITYCKDNDLPRQLIILYPNNEAIFTFHIFQFAQRPQRWLLRGIVGGIRGCGARCVQAASANATSVTCPATVQRQWLLRCR